MALVTAESVGQACLEITLAGETPTVDRVKDRLGGGSPNAILPLLRAWKEAQKGAARSEGEAAGAAESGIEVITPEMEEAADALKRGFTAVMRGFIEQERNRAAAAQQAIQQAAEQKVNLARQAADQQMADVTAQAKAEIDEAWAEAQRQAEHVEKLTGERDGLAAQLDAARGQTEELAAALREEQAARQIAETAAGKAAGEVEALRETVVQAEARVIAAEKAVEAAEHRVATAESAVIKAEAARDLADGERRQAAELARQQLATAETRIGEVTADRDKAREDLAAATARASAQAAHDAAEIRRLEEEVVALRLKVDQIEAGRREATAAAAGLSEQVRGLEERLSAMTDELRAEKAAHKTVKAPAGRQARPSKPPRPAKPKPAAE